MKFEIVLGKETISLLNTVKAFKIGKLEMIQKWWVKNEEQIKVLSSDKTKTHQIVAIKNIQEKLLFDMAIIKEASVHEGQGVIWDTKSFNNYKKKTFVVTKEQVNAEESVLERLFNSSSPEEATKFIAKVLTSQKTSDLISFLKPILMNHLYEAVEIKVEEES